MESESNIRAGRDSNQESSLSALIQKLVYISSQTDEEFTDNPLERLQNFGQNNHQDFVEYWSDEHFALEMGFGDEVVADTDVDNTLSNVMQNLSKF